MRKGRMPARLKLMLAAMALVLLAIPGLWVYMSLTATPASFLTFPEHGITVAVTSNISYANTASLAVRVAEAFVNAGGGPAR